MFAVQRFDPQAQDGQYGRQQGDEKRKSKKSKKKSKEKKDKQSRKQRNEVSNGNDTDQRTGQKRRRVESEGPPEGSTLRVIAPEVEEGPLDAQQKLRRNDEAMDDLDINEAVDTLIEGDTSNDNDTTGKDVQQDDPGATEESPTELDPSSYTQPGQRNRNLSPEVAAVLHMSSLPIREAAERWKLAPFLVDNLERDGYKSFFPIQSLVIPDVIASEHHARILRVRDVCVAAPTGSGKTLAFCLPVLNSLSTRVVRRLRALVILPSRDLARQVYSVFCHYSQGSNLKIGLAIGQTDFKDEQRGLVVGDENVGADDDARRSTPTSTNEDQYRHKLNPYNLDLAMRAFPPTNTSKNRSFDDSDTSGFPLGGHSAVDVLVATPGRLVDHLDKTPGFTLQHLRFLVIDEADRLVSQSYHSFVRRIMDSVHEPTEQALLAEQQQEREREQQRETTQDTSAVSGCGVDPIGWRRPRPESTTLQNTFGKPNRRVMTASVESVHSRVCQMVQLRKLLFSATLTKDPQKLAGLGLVNPKHYDAHHLRSNGPANGSSNKQHSMPTGLSEYTVECTAEQKPLILLAVLLEELQSEKESVVVVFTSSVDSTHRLVRLLQLLWGSAGLIGGPSCVAEFSSSLSQTQRSHLVEQCQQNQVSVVVCSDGMSRGMDIARVGMVVNYDVPRFAKTYVHRCGRTARAGRTGRAVSLLKGGQVQQFRSMRAIVEDPGRLQSLSVKKELVRGAFPRYKLCVGRLKEVLEAEEDGEIDKSVALPSAFFDL